MGLSSEKPAATAPSPSRLCSWAVLAFCAAALVWCWLYDRHPNIVPLALSHGLGTLALRYAFDEAMIGRLRIGAAYLRQ